MATMEEWLRLQAERAQARLVVTRSAMASTPVNYFSVQRMTGSDVISVITTTTIDGPSQHSEDIEAEKATDLRESRYTSPLRNPDLLTVEERERRNKALWREADLFLSKLAKARGERETAETTAAVKIQTVFRGYRWRKFIKAERKKKTVRLRLRHRIKFLNKSMGMVIQEREKKEYVLEQQRRAVARVQATVRGYFARRAARKERQMLQEEVLIALAVRIQCMVRRRIANRVVRKLRLRWYQERQLVAARHIQRVFRGHQGRRTANVRRVELEKVATIVLQRKWRRVLAYRARHKEHVRRQIEIKNDGALGVQTLFRSKLARKRINAMRNAEDELLKSAATLTVQRVFRGHLDRVLARDRRWRLEQARRSCAACHINRVARGFLGRCSYRDEADRIAADIFEQARLGNHKNVQDRLAGFGTDVAYTINSVDKDGNTVLHIAARWGHKKIVRYCLRSGMQIDLVNDARETGLQLAVMHSHTDVAEYLISKGAAFGYTGRTLLHEAAQRGMATTILAFIASHMPVDEQDESGKTALHCAAEVGSVPSLQSLLDRGAMVNAVNNAGHTPLHLAAMNGHVDATKVLLAAEADPSLVDNDNKTAWRLSVTNGHEMVANILRAVWSDTVGAERDELVSHTASADDKDRIFSFAVQDNAVAVEKMLKEGMPVDFVDANNTTILMAACAAGAVQVIELCLRKGANVKRANKEGRTALHVGAPIRDVSMMLLAKGAEAGVLDRHRRSPVHEAAKAGWVMSEAVAAEMLDVNMLDEHGTAPLHEAAARGFTSACDQLMKLGARPNTVDKNGNTALLLACRQDNADCVRLLLSRGGRVNDTNNAGDSPLHVAIKAKQADITGLLLEAGADVTAVNGENFTATRLAVEQEGVECLSLCLSYGGSAGERDNDGHTPLYAAIKHHNNLAVQRLLALDANCMEEYNSGSTPLHIAAAVGNKAAAKMLFDSTAMTKFMVEKANKAGDVPLMSACRSGKGGAMGIILDYESPLPFLCAHVAATAPKSSALRTLIAHDSSFVNATDPQGRTPLHYAAAHDRVPQLRMLLEAGANEAAESQRGQTALQLAKIRGRTGAQVFLSTHADAVGDEEGDTDDEPDVAADEDTRMRFQMQGMDL